MSDCASCYDPLPEEGGFARCSNCEFVLHFECAEITEASWNRWGQKRRENWKCKACVSKPVMPKDSLIKMQQELLTKVEETIKAQFALYEERFNTKLKEFQNSMDFFSSKIDEYEKSNRELLQKVITVEKSQKHLEQENYSLNKQLTMCQTKMENLEQYTRNRNLQIEGVPEVSGERMEDIVGRISELIKEPVDFKIDVQAAHRVPTKRAGGQKPIILQFSNRQKRNEFLKKSKRAVLTSTDFVRNAPATKVYVNEHLTPFNKNLLFHAKQLKEKGFKFVWVSEGKIFVRKEDNGNRLRISTANDLIKLGVNVENELTN